MAQPIVIISDPGIDGAFAITLAMLDPELEVVGLAATPGNVGSAQATKNVHAIINQIDAPRLPRLGAAPDVHYEIDGADIHGPGGLGGVSFPVAQLHHSHSSAKLVAELVRQYGSDITVVCLGPATVMAQALEREPELFHQVDRLVFLGGAWHEPGNVTAVSEFHIHCDPVSARMVLQCGASITLVPLDVMRRVLFSPSDLLELPRPNIPACRFLRQIIPHGIRASSNRYGIEGFHLKDVLGIAAVALPGAVTTRPMYVDVETRGELTRGMLVVDARAQPAQQPNVDLAIDVHTEAVRDYIDRVLSGRKS